MLHIQNQLAESRIWCERRMGQLLSGLVSAGNPQLLHGEKIGLKDVGVSAVQSHRWQVLADGTDDEFRAIIDDIKGGGRPKKNGGVAPTISQRAAAEQAGMSDARRIPFRAAFALAVSSGAVVASMCAVITAASSSM